MDNNALIQRAQQGDENAFGELYERCAPVVFRYLYSHLEQVQDAEDLTEEVFFRAWRALPRYRQQGVPFQAYLLRIARNVLIDHYRRDKSSQNQHATPVEDLAHLLPDPSVGPMSVGMEHQELVHKLRNLPEDHRTVLVLRFLNGLTPLETAQVMGRSAGAVRVLQHRALTAFRALLELEVDEDEN